MNQRTGFLVGAGARVLLALCTVAASNGAAAQSDAARWSLRYAQAEIGAERVEHGVMVAREALLKACTALERDAEIERELRALIEQHDAASARRGAAFGAAAAGAIELADGYAERGWLRVAAQLCEQANELVPGVAAERLDGLAAGWRAQVEAGTASAQFVDWRRAESLSPGVDWTQTIEGAVGPAAARDAALLMADFRPLGPLRFSAEIQVTKGAGPAGLVMGYTSESRYVAVDVEATDEGVIVTASERDGDTFQPRKRVPVQAVPVDGVYTIPLTLDTTSGKMLVSAGNREPFEMPGRPALRVGGIGLVRRGKTEVGDPPRWTALRVVDGGIRPVVTPFDADAEGLMLGAEQAQADGNPEVAAALALATLHAAARDLDGSVRRRVEKSARALHDAVDPEARATRTALKAIAKQVLPLAREYQRAEWHATRVAVLEATAGFDPVTADRHFEKARNDAAYSRPPTATESVFGRHRIIAGSKSWRVSGDAVQSPTIAADEKRTEAIGTQRTFKSGQRIELEIHLGTSPSKGGLVIGARDVEGAQTPEYVVVDLAHERGYSWLQGFYWDPVRRSMKQDKSLHFWFTPSERRAGIAVTVEFDAGLVRWSMQCVDRWASLRLPAGIDGDGGIGFFVSGNTERKEPVEFRKVRVGEL